MTRLDSIIIGILAAALSTGLAALFLYYLTLRQTELSFAAIVTLAALIAVVVPAVTATVTGRTVGPRGGTAWLSVFAGVCLLLAAVFGFLVV